MLLAPAGTAWQGTAAAYGFGNSAGKKSGNGGARAFLSFADWFYARHGQRFGRRRQRQKISTAIACAQRFVRLRSPIQLTPMQQEIVKKLEEKASRPGYKVNIRLVTSSTTPGNASSHMRNLLSSFLQYNMPPFNGLQAKQARQK